MPLTTVTVSFFALIATGCHQYVPVDVTVLHAITNAPVEGIRLEVHYHRYLDPFAPKLDSAVTDSAGHARLNISRYSTGSSLWIDTDNYNQDVNVVNEQNGQNPGSYLLTWDNVEPSTLSPVVIKVLTVEEWRHKYMTLKRQ